MNIGEVVFSHSGQINPETDLYPASFITNEEEKAKYEQTIGKNLYLFKEVQQFADHFEVDASNFYYSAKGLIALYYYDFPMLVEIPALDIDFMQTTGFRKKTHELLPKLRRQIEESDFYYVFAAVDERIRIYVFNRIFAQVPVEEKYELFKDLYVETDYGVSQLDASVVKEAIDHQTEEYRANVKNALDEQFDSDEIVVFRGQGDKSTPAEQSMSWTTNEKIAYFFARRLSLDGEVYRAKVKKKDVIDYIHDRNEAEILVLPQHIYDLENLNMVKTEEELENMNSYGIIGSFHRYLTYLPEELFFHPKGIHGMLHTKRVLLHVLSLAFELELNDFDTHLLAMAALYHDIGRTTDDVDDEHGLKSWRKLEEHDIVEDVIEPEFELYGFDIEILRFIIENHCISDQEGLNNLKNMDIPESEYERATYLYKIFKDADGLDRVRIGDLDTQYLRLPESKRRVLFAYGLYKGVK